MAHIVQCRWCKEKFDTDKVDEEKWIMPAKGQYYHIDCWNENREICLKNDFKTRFKAWVPSWARIAILKANY